MISSEHSSKESLSSTPLLTSFQWPFSPEGSFQASISLLRLSMDYQAYPSSFSSVESFEETSILTPPQRKHLVRILLDCQAHIDSFIQQELTAGPIPEDLEGERRILNALYSLLIMRQITEEQDSRVLALICTVTEVQIQHSALERVVLGVKDHLMQLGWAIMESHGIKKPKKEGNEEGNCSFSESMSGFIKVKEVHLETMKYEICRICEDYISIAGMAHHLLVCEMRHQKDYLEEKLIQKGEQLLEGIKADPCLQSFFDLLYCPLGQTHVSFNLRDDVLSIEEIIHQFRNEESELLKEVLVVLQDYCCVLNKEEVKSYESGRDEGDCKYRSKHSFAVSKKSLNMSKKSIRFHPNTSFANPSKNSIKCLDSEELIKSRVHSENRISSSRTINSDSSFCCASRNQFHLADLQILSLLGKGSFSEVYLVRKKNTNDLFAMKVIQFNDITCEKMAAFKKEQRIYRNLSQGYNVKLNYSFAEDNLYFLILDYAPGGSLAELLEREVYLDEEYARIYVANLILAANSLHNAGIVHRDLKPENVVIDSKGFLILTDFNLSKIIEDKKLDETNAFFGSPDYIAPEVILADRSDHMRDYFSIGVMTYEMLIGARPFADCSPQAVFKNILKGDIEWPDVGSGEGMISPEAKSFIEAILEADPAKRLGAQGLQSVKQHPFFANFNWSSFESNTPLYVPEEASENIHEDPELLERINARRRGEVDIPQVETVVRYDILKRRTSRYAKAQKQQMAKLERQIEVLKEFQSEVVVVSAQIGVWVDQNTEHGKEEQEEIQGSWKEISSAKTSEFQTKFQ